MTDANKKIQAFLNATKGLRESAMQEEATASAYLANKPKHREFFDADHKNSNLPKDITKSFKQAPKTVEPQKVEKLKKGGKTPGHGPLSQNGGHRENSGRKPKVETVIAKTVRGYIDEFVVGDDELSYFHPQTGKKMVMKKPRSIILLEMLYKKGKEQGDTAAIREFFDRAVGKSAQPIRGDDSDDTPIRLEHDISSILDKAYGDDDDD